MTIPHLVQLVTYCASNGLRMTQADVTEDIITVHLITACLTRQDLVEFDHLGFGIQWINTETNQVAIILTARL